MESIRYHYSVLYKCYAAIPELARFRRYTELSSWMLYNQSSAIDKLVRDINGLLAEIHGGSEKGSVFTVTDYHRAYIQDDISSSGGADGQDKLVSSLESKTKSLEDAIRQYSNDLLAAHEIAKLPHPYEIHDSYFRENFKSLFDHGVFGPTNEDSSIYEQVSAHSDLASLKGLERKDLLTTLVLRCFEPTREYLKKRIRKALGKEPEKATSQQGYTLESILLVLNILTGVYVSCLFAGGMAILSCVKSEKMRIVVLGAICLVVIASLAFCVPNLKRSDLFAVTAAFCAVGGIYIGTKSSGGQ